MLPIVDFEKEIIETVCGNRVTIITAETGAGKTTQVPQFLLRLGYNIVVTEPRRLAARSAARRVAYEHGSELGNIIGYRTAFEHCDSEETRCLFVTDGLELVREIHSDRRPDVLIIDEVHEWNLNIETLIAWSKKRLAEDPDFKVVIMSATLESDRLSEYFDNAPVIEVPGRLFPVEEIAHRHPDIVAELFALVKEGRNVLVFQPGKREIAETIQALRDMNLQAEILPLHGELDPEEQDRIFQHYHLPKVIVSTNVAQTSITIDDIDAVVDSGLERRVETTDGIEGLYLRRTAKADDLQRRGRAGRCKPGIYINCYAGRDEQLEFPVAEIQRVRLDQLVLRLARNGFDAEELEFFHQPDREAIVEAKRCLHALGAMDDNEQVTAVGRKISNFPLSVKFARMIVEAEKLGVVDDVITIAACLEVKGITDNREEEWWFLTSEQKSDLLAQMDVYDRAIQMNNKEELRDNGVHPKSFYRAREIRGKLIEVVERMGIDPTSCGDKDKIVRACVAGMVDHLYSVKWRYSRRGKEGICYSNESELAGIIDPSSCRRISKNSVVDSGSWVVGLPLDIELEGRWGQKFTIYLVTMVSVVEPKLLTEIAPHLIRVERKNFSFDKDKRLVSFEEVTVFNGTDLPERNTVSATWPEMKEKFPDQAVLEEIRQELIREQFFSFGFRYKEEDLGPGWDPKVSKILELRPREYGIDPATGNPLKAYPAVIKRALPWGEWCIRFFPTIKEAAEASKEFEEIYPQAISRLQFDSFTAEGQKPSGKWEDLGQRWWRCPNGHSVRALKDATRVECKFCREEKTT